MPISFEVHAHRIVNPKRVYQGVGIYNFLFRDLLQFLNGGHDIVGQIGQIVLPNRFDAQILQRVVDPVHLFAFQIHVLKHVHKLAGRKIALLFPALDQLAQFIRALNPFHDLQHPVFPLLHLLFVGKLNRSFLRGYFGGFYFIHGSHLP